MKAIRRFTVRTHLPEPLAPLGELVMNLRWTWHPETTELLASADPETWEAVGRDPYTFLGAVSAERLEELAADRRFLRRLQDAADELHDYMTSDRWYQSLDDGPRSIAYFSPEYGLHEALPQYSGGLGILAGDHLKAASDLGIPIIGVGLLYKHGYFTQSLSPEGWQFERYPPIDPNGLPLTLLRDDDGAPVRVSVGLPGDRTLDAQIWKAQVGRVPLLLIDSDVEDNDPSARDVTDRLYGGGNDHRLEQEMLLGIGGVRALRAYCGLTGRPEPEVFHTNEGHAGFLGMERISDLIREGLYFGEALQVVRAGTVFTTHTPVPAGIDRFDLELVSRYFSTDLLPGVAVQDVLALGSENYEGGSSDTFNMAVMGLRLGQRANGVSKLHGEVSRGMFGALWPGFDTAEVPITSVTNGVHAPTWVDPMLGDLAIEKFGKSDTTSCDWSSEIVSDADLWNVRNAMRSQLVEDARSRVAAAWGEQNPGIAAPNWYSELLDPNVLTIGFARRVPTYKRLTLMLHDPERLRALLLHPEHPVQIVIAGKSHPADDEGKRLIQKLVEFASEHDVRKRIVFLPNYDIAMAQLLYPGTDVWLNNPLRPLEACGTSGMKAALNGSLNLSILDGWWAEYYDAENGWAIPTADSAGDSAERDELEADAMYDLIEHQIAPRFYDRNADGVPTRWVQSIRHTLATLSPELSADRMVQEYVNRLYVPAALAERTITAGGLQPARDLAEWKARVIASWPKVHVTHVESGGVDAVSQVGDVLHVRAHVELDGLWPDDVSVEVSYGKAREGDRLVDVQHQPLELVAQDLAQPPTFGGTVTLERAGSFGYNVRVVPKHPLLASAAELGLITVAE